MSDPGADAPGASGPVSSFVPPLSVVFMGTPEFSVPILEALAARFRVVGVYSQPPRAAGRGKKPRPGPVHARARDLGLPVFTPARLRDPAEQAVFAGLGADVAVVAAYGLMLPRPVLAAPRLGCVNVHASLLPRWRGAAPIQRAIMAGDRETGITLMQMDAGLDTGPMLCREPVAITPETTGQSLHDALSALGARMIGPALEDLAAGRLTAIPQPDDGVTHAAKIDKAEARLDWTRSAVDLDRQARALSPFPGAWFAVGEERVKVLMTAAPSPSSSSVDPVGDDEAGPRPPGSVVALPDGGAGRPGLVIACGPEGRDRLWLLTLQRAGKAPLAAGAFVRGFALPVGTRLG